MSPPIYTPDGNEVSEIVLPDGSTASQVIGPDGNVVFEAGPDIPDFTVWTIKQGSPTLLNDSATLSANDDAVIYSDSTATTGSWSWNFTYGNGNSGNDYGISFISQTTNVTSKLHTEKGYIYRFNRNGQADLIKSTPNGFTSLISFGWDNDSDQHSATVTRDENGNFEVFYDEVSQGSIQDTTYTTSSYIMIDNDTDVNATVSSLTFD